MYCPNCGEKLRNINQNFCSNCGSEISTLFKTTKLTTERDQYASTTRPQSTLESSSPPSIQYKVIKTPIEGPDVYSKRCLAFSITSLALTFPYWGYYLIRLILPFTIPPVGLQLIRSIVIFIAVVVGLVFGILAKINSSKAGKLEPPNSLKKVGSVLAIIGIVFNAQITAITFFIPLVIIPI